jgi:hypothetical protein
MFERRISIEDWIAQASVETERGGPLSRLSLVHYVGEVPSEVDKVDFPNKNLTVRGIAERFNGRIADFVHDMPGPQSCALLAFYGDSQEPGDTRPFVKNGRTALPPGLASEPPTPAGLTQMAMRHAETMFGQVTAERKLLTEGWAQLAAGAISQVRDKDELISRLQKENGDAWILVRDIGLQMEDKTHERQVAAQKAERNDMLLGRMMKWLPAILNNLTGKQVFPQSAEDTAIVEGILSEIGPEQIKMLEAVAPAAAAPAIALLSKRANKIFDERVKLEVQRGEARQLTEGTIDAEGELQ